MGLDITWAVDWVRRSADVIGEHRVELITLDREIGDGDHGENMDRGFQAVLPKLDDLPAGSTPGDVLKLVATTLISTVGGAAGPLYGTAYLKGRSRRARRRRSTAPAIAEVLAAARDGIVMRGKAEVGDKTMIDAWTPAVDAAEAAAGSGADAAAVLSAAADAAGAGADRDRTARRPEGSRELPRGAQRRSSRPGCTVHRAAVAGCSRHGRRGGGGVRWRHPAKSAWSSSRTPRASRTGLVELSRARWRPTAALVAAGGTDDGRIGTSFDLVSTGIAARRTRGRASSVLCDLGSAILTAETALDFLDDDVRARVRIVDAPLVEGGVAAAVAAEAGDDLDQVVAAAESARDGSGPRSTRLPRPMPRGSVTREVGAASIRSLAGRDARERGRTARPTRRRSS